VPGIPELGSMLAQNAALPGLPAGKIRSELRQVRWDAPTGCVVNSLRILSGEVGRTLPTEPPRVQKLVVISPFLDGTVVEAFGKWGDANTNRTLLSSRSELTKLAAQAGKPLARFSELLFLDSPIADDETDGDAADRENADSQDEEPEPRGLHAKLIYAESPSGRRIWTGSANATQRGWTGPNTEVITELDVTPEVTAGLEDFVKSATTVRHEELGDAAEADPIEERLEEARKQVASAWNATQRYDDSGPILSNSTDPNPTDEGVELSVGLLGAAQITWPRGSVSLHLPRVAAGEVTELVRCRLAIGDASVSWLQRAPIDPPPGDERDRQALARYLDPRTFLLWIRSLLTGEPLGDGGGDWDDHPESHSQRIPPKAGPTWWAPTIEEVLKSWSRDPSSLGLINKKVRQYLKLYEQQTGSELAAEERKVVADFHATWQVVTRSLLTEEP
jgi:hypothetical protein